MVTPICGIWQVHYILNCHHVDTHTCFTLNSNLLFRYTTAQLHHYNPILTPRDSQSYVLVMIVIENFGWSRNKSVTRYDVSHESFPASAIIRSLCSSMCPAYTSLCHLLLGETTTGEPTPVRTTGTWCSKLHSLRRSDSHIKQHTNWALRVGPSRLWHCILN
jgi:hypothetical protein